MQKNKGITLVALVITIIILLILAGVAISMITGGEGLFAQTNGAATKYNQAAKNEADLLEQLLNGNYTFGGNEETPKEPVPDLIKESNMDFIYKPDIWTNGTVNVEIITSITGYTLQYSLDEGENWYNYTEEIPVTTNGKVILARLADGDRTGGIATGQVENIDTQGPKAFNLTTTAEETSITVSAEGIVEDADEIEGVSGKSGIRGYQFKLMNSDGTTKVDWTKEQAEPSYTFNTGLTAGTTYKVSMVAIDNAENPTEATNKEQTVSTLAKAPENTGEFNETAKVNTPDTSKLPATTKYVTWTGTSTFTPQETTTAPTNWYDYNNGQWANIKTTSTDNSLEAYWVWIPRFAYKLPESSTAKQIEVAFVKNTSKTVVLTDGSEVTGYYSTEVTTDNSGLYSKKTADAASKWIIHPAFWWDNDSDGIIDEGEQLSGIWVGKFETISSNPSASNSGGNDISNLKAQIKPGYASWRSIQVANMFTVCENMKKTGGVIGTTESNNSGIDTHMMKNMEWGAVAILSQSKYGVYNPKSTNGGQIWNNPNSSYITGTVAKAENSKDANSVTDTDCDRYNTGNGPKASTTGTVYGVYDMAGGSWEYVMGLMSPSTDATIPSVGRTTIYSTGFNGKYYNGTASTNGLRDLPAKKYYDMYAYGTSKTDYTRGKIGDATSELQPAGSYGWNGDYAFFPFSDYTVFDRGGGYYNGTLAGVFNFSSSSSGGGYGAGYSGYGFRAVLLAV